MWLRMARRALGVLVVVAFTAVPAGAADQPGRVAVGAVDKSAFPDMQLTVAALNTGGVPLTGLTADPTPVLGDQVEMARFLISRGADVNHIDTNGMTALLYAASIDFGTPAMIEMLLKAGARTDMKTKQGKTALELAREYKHTHLIPSLERSVAAAN